MSDNRLLQDFRALRANALASYVMNIVAPYITNRQDNEPFKAKQALFKAFHDAGFEVVTDMDRARAGLQSRDEMGWTADELRAMEDAMKRAWNAAPLVKDMT